MTKPKHKQPIRDNMESKSTDELRVIAKALKLNTCGSRMDLVRSLRRKMKLLDADWEL